MGIEGRRVWGDGTGGVAGGEKGIIRFLVWGFEGGYEVVAWR